MITYWCALIVFLIFRGCVMKSLICYRLDDVRPGIDPEAAVRLILAGLLSGVVHDQQADARGSG
jgi:hypothetical protein